MRGAKGTRQFVIAVAALVALGPDPVAAAGDERLALPFECALDQGRVRLTPSKERLHAIVGVRQERVVLACGTGPGRNCRTMVAHRFSLACGGREVAWQDVAEAIGGRRTSRVWRDAGRLHLAMVEGLEPDASMTRPCATDRPDAAGEAATRAGNVEKIVMKPCGVTKVGEPLDTRQESLFVMPPGFAPVTHFGGRIVRDGGQAATQDRPKATTASAVMLAAAAIPASPPPDQRRRLLERTIISEPLPEISARPAAGPETGTLPVFASRQEQGEAWRVTVAKANVETPSPNAVTTMPAPPSGGILWLLMTAGLLSLGVIAWRQPVPVTALARRMMDGDRLHRARALVSAALPDWLRPASAVDIDGDGRTYPAATVEETYDAVAAAVRAVDGKLSLRSVLDDELRRVKQRLAVAKAASAGESGECRLPGPAFRVLMRDLERIRRIAASATEGISASGTTAALRMPQSRSEAFDVLGINPNVSDATVKKVVEALRMSWHPDLAHDASDRQLREERIKQINIAAELISEKRRVA